MTNGQQPKKAVIRRVSHEATFVGTVLDMEKSEAFRNEGTNPVLSDPQRLGSSARNRSPEVKLKLQQNEYTKFTVSECAEPCCFSHKIPIFTEFFYLIIYAIICFTPTCISKRHGKPPLGTAGIVVICLRLYECYSSRGIRKESPHLDC